MGRRASRADSRSDPGSQVAAGPVDSPPLPTDLARAYRLLADATHDAVVHGRVIFERDRPVDWVHLSVNAAFVEITGLGGAAGNRATDLVQGLRESDPQLFELFGRVARDGTVERTRMLVRALSLPIELTAFGTEPGCFVAVFRPTEDAKASAVGHEHEDRLRLFIEHAPASVAMFDREMRFLAVSTRYARDRRVEPWELIGRRLYDVFPEVEARAKHLHDRCLAGAIEAREWDVFPHRDGTEEPFRWEIRPWREPSGALSYTEMAVQSLRAEEPLRADLSEVLGAIVTRWSPRCAGCSTPAAETARRRRRRDAAARDPRRFGRVRGSFTVLHAGPPGLFTLDPQIHRRTRDARSVRSEVDIPCSVSSSVRCVSSG